MMHTGRMKTSSLAISVLCGFLLCVFGQIALAQSDYTPRNYYGAKFEPVDGILHGAGQTYYRDAFTGVCSFADCLSEAAERYTDVLGTSQAPLLFMDYNNSTTDNTPSWYAGMKSRIDLFETNYDRQLAAQLGTFLQPGTVLLNAAQINNIVNGLASLDRPVFYRPGYEANGPWFGLDPNTYKANFRAVSDAIRAADLPVAMVWNVVVGDGGAHSTFNNALNYYPGDEYVDWWSLNNFGSVTFTPGQQAQVDFFLEAADISGFPVLIGEATPQFIGADDAADWNSWFDPFFDRIKDNPVIKAHTYINWDWGQTNPGDGWTNWGDASLENADATVLANYIDELSDPIYVHSGSTLPDFFFDSVDFNQDFAVGTADLSTWEAAYGNDDSADADGNGLSEGLDFLAWQQSSSASLVAAVSAVPEPTTLLLLLGGMAGLACQRRKR